MYGGVNGFTTEHFKKINGYSNLFWNWGGEDDDLRKRYNLDSNDSHIPNLIHAI